jgi:hypothetical protein
MSDEAAAIADDVLTRFNQATRARDLDVSLAVLTDDPTVYGSGSGETAIGRAAVTAFGPTSTRDRSPTAGSGRSSTRSGLVT